MNRLRVLVTARSRRAAASARPGERQRREARVVALMGFEALTLAVISSLHLSGVLGGGVKPFNPTAAGVAEALICLVLVFAALALRRFGARARTAALAATLFAIVGFIVGLTFTVKGGDPVDITYHVTLLPLLLITLAAMPRR